MEVAMNDLARGAARNVERLINGRVLHDDTIDPSGSALLALNNGSAVSVGDASSSRN
ncbi:hypothetical protein [Bradyrhizobium embrapense]|uniref:hypothetical protein n=1 Tax=Bradyrhizobium embrapense TaxID=630921 RepID=UPI0012F50A7D|nr:hypothetical protein [Bradyrhizobium embrapense]